MGWIEIDQPKSPLPNPDQQVKKTISTGKITASERGKRAIMKLPISRSTCNSIEQWYFKYNIHFNRCISLNRQIIKTIFPVHQVAWSYWYQATICPHSSGRSFHILYIAAQWSGQYFLLPSSLHPTLYHWPFHHGYPRSYAISYPLDRESSSVTSHEIKIWSRHSTG